MIVQACINGARPRDFHPSLPLDAHAMASDAAACVAAGAAELHIHPRGADGRESLSAVDETVAKNALDGPPPAPPEPPAARWRSACAKPPAQAAGI